MLYNKGKINCFYFRFSFKIKILQYVVIVATSLFSIYGNYHLLSRRKEFIMADRVSATWASKPFCLCHGQWTLVVDGVDVSDKIPKRLRESEMNTHKTYRKWRFNNWQVEWTSYKDGLSIDEWITENKEWLNTITQNVDLQKEIFYAINECDWRHFSCGGCI